MSAIPFQKLPLFRICSFLNQGECHTVSLSYKGAKAALAGDQEWQKNVAVPLHTIREEHQTLEPETRTLLRERATWHPLPTVQAYVRETVIFLQAVSLQTKKDQLNQYSAALILRHAVTMTSHGCYMPEHPVLASLESGLQGKGTVEIHTFHSIAVLTQGSEKIAKLMKVGADKTWRDAQNYSAKELRRIQASYQAMAALGSRSVAPTRTLRDGICAQHYIPNSLTLTDQLLSPERTQILSDLNLAETQLHQLMSLIRATWDGHGGNTLVATDSQGVHLVDIDEEQAFSENNASVSEGFESGAPTAIVFGLPAGGRPLARSLLCLMSSPFWKEKCLETLQQLDLADHARACAERCDKIRAICSAELAKEKSLITPRDIFFALYGKDAFYELALEKGISPLYFFDRLVHKSEKSWCSSFESELFFDRMNPNYRAVEPTPGRPVFSLQPKTAHQAAAIVRQIETAVSHNKAIRCLEVLPEGFDLAGWEAYQKGHPHDSVTLKSFMLSHFLNGFPKRVARLINLDRPYFSLNVVKNNEGKLWLEVSHHPLVKEAFQKWEKNRDQETFEIMKLASDQLDFVAKKKFKPYFHRVVTILRGDELKYIVNELADAFENVGYLTIHEQPPGFYSLVFQKSPKD
jgi:hypothetical protein